MIPRVELSLVSTDRLAVTMGAAGVGNDTFAVTYDDRQIPVTVNVWWALRVYGHARVAVLDGGINRWRAQGDPLAAWTECTALAAFSSRFRPELYVTKDHVMAALADARGARLVDARMDVAWDAAGAHIPGATRLTGIGFLADGERWMSPDSARRRIEKAGVAQMLVITYCGGGVTATGTALAFRLAGMPDVAVYDGSWAEWELDPDTPKEPH
jgi:thiosulfate/3-mercaptopyruvate sulfurtransferase